MMIKYKWIILASMFSIGACSRDDLRTEEEKKPPVGQEIETDFYPKPPSGWMGETNPYTTTGWVGDIMPYYAENQFHIFFLHDAQQKPSGKGFHPIHKFQSENLVDFSYEGEMISYGEANEPDFAIGTGSPVKVGDTYYFYYTGHNGNSGFLQNNPRESVLLATSPDLDNWIKQEEFRITAPEGYYDFDFRDPHVFFNEEEQEYWMLISTQTSDRKAVVLLYTSLDPATHQWELQDPVYTTTEEENYLMLECADMFKMGEHWYLFFSENWKDKGTHYRISTSSKGPWRQPEKDMLDGEYFYAAKTASDGNDRFLFGWTARRSPENNNGNKEWGGNMVIHKLVQEADGTLGVKIPNQILTKFGTDVSLETLGNKGVVNENGGSFILNGSEDVAFQTFRPLKGTRKITALISFESAKGAAGFTLKSPNAPENGFQILVEPSKARVAAYKVTGNNLELVSQVSVEVKKELQLELIVEDNISVLYIDGKAALSNRIYGAIDMEWSIFANGVDAEFDLKLRSP